MNTALAWRIALPALVLLGLTFLDLPRPSKSPGIELRDPAHMLPASSGMVALGRHIFEDENLSLNRNQSCRTCHDPERSYAAPAAAAVVRGSVVQGSVDGQFGHRRPPSVAYASLVPIYTHAAASGGNNWDGRASGNTLGNPAADHALSSFLNPAEQAMPDAACVVLRLREASYLDSFTAVWGDDVLRIDFPRDAHATCSQPAAAPGELVHLSALDRATVDAVYRNIALSIMAFEASAVVNRFSSRFDERNLTPLQQRGARLFDGKAHCAECHPPAVLFSNATFHNVGVPRNPDNPRFNYTTMAADAGLGGLTGKKSDLGKFRTPTLRNVAIGDRTFMHNGVLTSLKQVVDFHNTRNVLSVCTREQLRTLRPAEYGSFDPDGAGPLSAARCWPSAETPQNVSPRLGDLGMTEAEVDAIVEFLSALRDL